MPDRIPDAHVWLCQLNNQTWASGIRSMFVHTVFFWLKHPERQDDRNALHAGLESLKSINAMLAAYVGCPAETRRPVIDYSYDFSLTLVFPDKAGHDTYQDHPVHLEFVAECGHLWERVQIYDAVSV